MGAGKGNNKVRLAAHGAAGQRAEASDSAREALITVTLQGPLAVTEELHIISFVVEYVYQGLKMKLQVSAGKGQGGHKQKRPAVGTLSPTRRRRRRRLQL